MTVAAGQRSTSRSTAIKGTAVEKLLMNDGHAAAIIAGYQPAATRRPADVFDRAMTRQPWLSQQSARGARATRFQTLATQRLHLHGRVRRRRDPGHARWSWQGAVAPTRSSSSCASRSSAGLADHEMGHTMGLRHNFAASTDALNYDDQYWNIRGDGAAGPMGRRQADASTRTRRSWTTARGSTATSTAWASTTTRRSASATASWST